MHAANILQPNQIATLKLRHLLFTFASKHLAVLTDCVLVNSSNIAQSVAKDLSYEPFRSRR